MAAPDLSSYGEPVRGVDLSEYGTPVPTDAKPVEGGLLNALGRTVMGGARQTGRALGATIDVLQHDNADLAAASRAQQADAKDPRLQGFLDSIAAWKQKVAGEGREPGWLESAGAVAGAVKDNPMGALLMIPEQLPNSAVVLGGGYAGLTAGSLLAGPVGGVVGGLAGMFAGNAAVETGGKGLERAAKGALTDQDFKDTLQEGAIKGAVVTGVDALTLGLSKPLVSAGRRAAEKATEKVLSDAGVDITSKAATEAALLNPKLVSAVQEAQAVAIKATQTVGSRVLRGGGALALETFGEGLGEYLGEYAATGRGDKVDAIVEAFSSLGQSAGELAYVGAKGVVMPSPKPAIADAETFQEAHDAFKFDVESTRPTIDLNELAKSYKDHTPEDLVAQQEELLKAVSGNIEYARAEDGTHTFNGAPLKVVAAQDLPLEGEGLTRHQYEAISALNEARGKRTIVYANDARLPDGMAQQPDVAFISSHTTFDPVVVAEHEVQHLSEEGEKQATFARVVQEELTAQAEELAIRRHGKLDSARLAQEIRGDIAGDAMADPTFHTRVIQKMTEQLGEKAAESHAQAFLESLKGLIDRIKAILTGKTFSSPDGQRLATQYVNNLERVHDALAAAMADQFITKGYRPPGAQTNTSQHLLARALREQEERAAALKIPEGERTYLDRMAINRKPLVAPEGSSATLISALGSTLKHPSERTFEERLNIDAIKAGVRMSPKARVQMRESFLKEQSDADRKAGYKRPFKNPVRFKDGSRISGFSDPGERTTFYGYDKNGELFSQRAVTLKPEDFDGAVSNDSNRTAEDLRQSIMHLRAQHGLKASPKSRPTDAQFAEVQKAQRYGGPEDLATKLGPKGKPNLVAEASGKFQRMAEHIGDLVHRAAMPSVGGEGVNGGGHEYGLQALLEKAERALRQFADTKDFIPQARRNFEFQIEEGTPGYVGKTVDELVAEFLAASQKYADAYRAIPVLTEMQELGRDAAVALGEHNYPALKRNLEALVKLASSTDAADRYHELKFSPKSEKDKIEAARATNQGTYLNVGLSTAELRGPGTFLHQSEVERAIKALGANVIRLTTTASKTEPTAVVRIDRPLTLAQLDALSVTLHQEAIPQLHNGAGIMGGPKASAWGPFNPDFFYMPNGKTMSKNASPFAKNSALARPVPESVDAVSTMSNAIAVARGQKFATGRDFKLAIQQAVRAAAAAVGVDLSQDTPEIRNYIRRSMLREVQDGIRTNANAIGWYDEKVTKALRVLSLLHPEIVTDPQSKFAFIWALAVTSNGMKVNKNFVLAERAYASWKRTGGTNGGKFDEVGEGPTKAKINDGLNAYRTLMDKHGYEALSELMLSQASVREIQAATGIKPSGEGLDEILFGAAILGPKIGNGFFMNLNGEFGQLTMDRWWQRMWGRLTGTLVLEDKQKVLKAKDQFLALIRLISSDAETKKAVEDTIAARLATGNAVATAEAIQRATMGEEVRLILQDAMPAAGETYGKLVEIQGQPPKGKEFLSVGDELRKAALRYLKSIDGQKEAPTPADRRMMRAIASQVLAEVQKANPDITMADMQAILWYPEKRVYDSAGLDETGEEGYEDSEAPDYANAAIRLARDNGITQDRIDHAVTEAENDIQARKRAGRGGRESSRLVAAGEAGEGTAGEVSAAGTEAGARTESGEVDGQQTRSDARGRGPARASPKASLLPAHGTSRPDGVDVYGTHYSGSERSSLASSQYGTGAKGAEYARVQRATDPRLKQRVYFYLDTGSGTYPEKYVGNVAHGARLNGLYDIAHDPLDLYLRAHEANLANADDRMNAFESALLDAGFDGYFTREFGGQGAAVLVGQRRVDVLPVFEQIGEVVSPMAPFTGAKLRAREIMADKSLPLGQMSGERWMKLVPDAKLDADRLYYKDEVARAVMAQKPELKASPKQEETPAERSARWEREEVEAQEKAEALQAAYDENPVPGVSVSFEKYTSDEVELANIEAKQKGRGRGSAAMSRILELADTTGTNLMLLPAGGGRRRERLVDFYERFGFREEDNGVMRRPAYQSAKLSPKQGAFYSELATKVEAAQAKAMPAKMWKDWIRGLLTKGVKQAEIDATGVNEWLDLQEGKVTREALAAYLEANGVQVQDVMLGEDPDLTVAQAQEILNAGGKVYAIPKIRPNQVGGATLDDGRTLLPYIVSHPEVYFLREGAPEDAIATRIGTKFASYQLPGGKNYRELLLTLPHGGRVFENVEDATAFLLEADPDYFDPKEHGSAAAIIAKANELANYDRTKTFNSSHFDQPNILAHVRFNERTDAEGKRVLFLEEIQSDWAQKGKKEGFAAAGVTPLSRAEADELESLYGQEEQLTEDQATRMNALEARRTGKLTPSGPFVQKTEAWVGLALKRMIKYAADNGFDRVAWTTGEQQAARYDLSKQVSSLIVRKEDGEYVVTAGRGGEQVIDDHRTTAEKLPDVIGKELADRAIKTLKQYPRRQAMFTGLDLKVGGEGMKTFYDKIVPNVANSVVKKYGVRVGEVDLTMPAQESDPDKIVRTVGGRDVADKKQPGFDVTPAMAGKQAMFSPKIVGDSKRAYTPEQRRMFQNTGRTINPPTLAEKVAAMRKDLGKKLAQGIVDQFAPLKELSPMAYMLARLSKGTAGAFEAMLHHGKLSIKDGAYDSDLSGGFVEKVGIPLKGEMEDFLWWVAANRAERLTAQDRERLFSKSDIAAGKSLADGNLTFDYTLSNGQTTRSRKAAYEDSLKKFDGFAKNALDMAEQSGLIDPAARKIWEHEFYVPFYRVSEEDGSFIGANIGNGLVRQRAFKKLKGGTDKLNSDLLANTLANWAHLLDAGAKNRAAKSALEAAAQMGVAVEADAATVKAMGQSIGKKNSTVWFSENGVPRHFLVDDPFVLTAITSLEYAGMKGPLMDAMSTFKHWLTVGVTANPAFKVKNLIRDSVQAIATSDIGYNPVTNTLQGIKASDRDSQNYVSALASGGLIRFGTMLEGRQADRVRQLVKMGVKDTTILNNDSKLQAMYDKYLEPAVIAYNELGNRSEEITRSALFEQLKAQNMDHATAALMARDLMDFSLQGSWTGIRFLTQVVPFMNARLQGMYKLGRAAQEDPKRMAAVIGATALFSLALLAAWGGDDDWKKREDWDRDNFWWFKLGGVAFRIPKPFEIGAIATLAERGVEYFTDPEMTGKRLNDRVLALLSQNLSMNPVPQLVKPILDVYANKSSFTGRPIETLGMERLAPDYRFTSSTSMLARGASTAGQAVTSTVGANFLSPVQIDSMLRGYFSWLGTFVVGASDLVARPLSGEPTRPAGDMWKTATGGMFAELPEGQSRYVSHIYDQAKIVEQAWGTFQSLRKEGKAAEAAEYLDKHRAEIAQHKTIEQVKKAESKLNERIRLIERSTYSPDVKKEMIARINVQKDQIARRIK